MNEYMHHENTTTVTYLHSPRCVPATFDGEVNDQLSGTGSIHQLITH